jgi:luciferase family oxidoreductase group 1
MRYHTAAEDFPRQVRELLAYLAAPRPGQALIAYPGAGANVPVWLLGSSTFSAQLAAELGLPFAFASHFAPALLLDAIDIYRRTFRPSAYLDKPYVMAGVPLVAAATDAEAERLATSAKLRHLQLIRGESLLVPPPVDSMDGRWSEGERFLVESRLTVAVIGGPEKVQTRLAELLRETEADELIFTSDVYDHAARLRSFEIASDAMKKLASAQLQEV